MASVAQAVFIPAMRKAGITRLPGTTPSTDQYGELIPLINRLLSSWSCDGHKVFSTDQYNLALTNNQVVYTIGPGADLDIPRPLDIVAANMIFPTNPPINQDLAILDAVSWAALDITQLPGTLIWALYYDHGYDANGWGRVYIFGQPPDNYQLQLYVWKALKSDFTLTTDSFLFPPGYEKALVDNMAVEIADLYPREAKITESTRREADVSLHDLKVLNADLPRLNSEAARIGGQGDSMFPWWYWQSH